MYHSISLLSALTHIITGLQIPFYESLEVLSPILATRLYASAIVLFTIKRPF